MPAQRAEGMAIFHRCPMRPALSTDGMTACKHLCWPFLIECFQADGAVCLTVFGHQLQLCFQRGKCIVHSPAVPLRTFHHVVHKPFSRLVRNTHSLLTVNLLQSLPHVPSHCAWQVRLVIFVEFEEVHPHPLNLLAIGFEQCKLCDDFVILCWLLSQLFEQLLQAMHTFICSAVLPDFRSWRFHATRPAHGVPVSAHQIRDFSKAVLLICFVTPNVSSIHRGRFNYAQRRHGSAS
mmetsp:Transcript_126515/g.236516  ORF Transcript_126515/g.236516 Transcript_126515/m.236516 type:complete len:235 (+) Transcript_126515:356-1060(+)